MSCSQARQHVMSEGPQRSVLKVSRCYLTNQDWVGKIRCHILNAKHRQSFLRRVYGPLRLCPIEPLNTGPCSIPIPTARGSRPSTPVSLSRVELISFYLNRCIQRTKWYEALSPSQTTNTLSPLYSWILPP